MCEQQLIPSLQTHDYTLEWPKRQYTIKQDALTGLDRWGGREQGHADVIYISGFHTNQEDSSEAVFCSSIRFLRRTCWRSVGRLQVCGLTVEIAHLDLTTTKSHNSWTRHKLELLEYIHLLMSIDSLFLLFCRCFRGISYLCVCGHSIRSETKIKSGQP